MRELMIPKFGVRKGVYGLTFLFAVLALVFTFTTLSKFDFQSRSLPFFTTTTTTTSFPSLLNTDSSNSENGAITNQQLSMDTIIQKLVEEIKELRELTSSNSDPQDQSEILVDKERLVNYTSFLTEILTFVGSTKAAAATVEHKKLVATEPGVATQAEAGFGHPLSKFIGTDQQQQQQHSSDGTNDFGDFFLIEEIKKYVSIKPNRLGKQNFMGANGTFTSIGHACFSMKQELEEYMDYDVGDFCNDDWKLAQKLMVHGCDPLPRRRCFSRAPKLYTKPLPINESLWYLPDDRNVRWSHYRCKNFACLARMNVTDKGFFKCADCFNLTHHEKPRWIQPMNNIPPASNMMNNNNSADFTIEEVLKIKQQPTSGEIRIGLDFSVGTGSFAARMREFNVTIISATINLGAPFSEMIALRGLIPLYLSINQRLPFFDNTLDMIHTTRFLDGWMDFILLDFVLYDWDRVLRPGGLLWVDSFFCVENDLEDYLDAFKMLRYKKHKWSIVPKVDKNGTQPEVFFSAVLEKPPRPF